MNKNERHAFFELMTKTATYYEKKLEREIIDIYWQDLESYELEDIRKALILHRHDQKRGRYLPKTVDIICHLQSAKKTNVQIIDFKHFHCSVRDCKNPGTLSQTTQGGNWVCRDHYRDINHKSECSPSSSAAQIVKMADMVKRSDDR